MSVTNQTGIAIAIVIGSFLVAATWWLSSSPSMKVVSGGDEEYSLTRTTDRHLYGSNRAPITIIEFSDVECPFCARLHPTLERIVDESNGGVNWEYRHLPLPNHRNAVLGAQASECVADLGSNDLFWDYLNVLLENQRVHNQDFYIQQASELGVPTEVFTDCLLNNERFAELIELDRRTALAFGGRGTPFSVIQYSDGSIKPVSGALPYEQWLALLEN